MVEHKSFSDKIAREAAELVAFDVLDPALRSRGSISQSAEQRAKQKRFRQQMTSLFGGSPTGSYVIPTLADLIERVEALEARLMRDD